MWKAQRRSTEAFKDNAVRDNLPKPAEDAAALAPDLSDKAARLDIPGGPPMAKIMTI